MASGRDLYNACCRFEGQPYSTAPGRTSPTSGHKDCSGLVAAGFEVCQGYELGAYVSVTIFEQSQRAGLEIPYYAAEHIVGALIFKPENPLLGWGSAGHIAVSDGYGGTIEATPPRVRRLPLSYNAPWSSHAALAIHLDYSNYGEGGGQPQPEPIPRPKEEDMFIVKNRDTGQRVLYTSLGSQEVDENFTNELAYAGVPTYEVPDHVADSVGIIHYAHKQKFFEDMPNSGGNGGGGAMRVSLEGTATPQ